MYDHVILKLLHSINTFRSIIIVWVFFMIWFGGGVRRCLRCRGLCGRIGIQGDKGYPISFVCLRSFLRACNQLTW